MSGKSDIVYLYDGTYAGFLCCVFQSFLKKEVPVQIWSYDREQPTLFPTRDIQTEQVLADRVQGGIHHMLGFAAERWVWDTWYSELENREVAVLDFLVFGFRQGPGVMGMSGHPKVAPVFAASRSLRNEAHLLTGFVRFSEIGGVLVATIQPKNFVLPFLEVHFSARFPREQYLIYDETHHSALIYANGEHRIVEMEKLELPIQTQQEENWSRLWKQFYDTAEIEQRHNPRCRMAHIPKRYWNCVQELSDETAVISRGSLPISVQQALQSGVLQLPGTPKKDAEAILTPTQASVRRHLSVDTSLPELVQHIDPNTSPF